jgi:putative membrane protein
MAADSYAKGENSMISKRMWSSVLLRSASALLAGATALAQNQPGGAGQQPGSQPTSPGMGSMGADTSSGSQQTMVDQSFVRKALEGGTAEVQLGQLAQQKSQSDDIKQFGQKMVDDHTALGDQLMKPIAKQLGLKEPKGPSKKDKELIAKLEALSGPQFDEEYIKAMVKDHKQDLKEFKDEAQMAQDPNVKQAAQQGAGMITQHLQLIEQIAQNHNIATEGKAKKSSGAQ